MVLDILAQQVSLESAAAAFSKLEKVVSAVTPEYVLTLSDRTLKEVGFSRQKAAYVRGLAGAILAESVRLEDLECTDNEEARRELLKLKGVGPWTADCYLLFSLRRADAWPTGDLALIKAVEEVKALPHSLSAEDADAIAEDWKPWRAVAARMLWHHYLCSRGRRAGPSNHD
jgi:DNA-3-methyladenine glycosylase II